MCSSITAVFVLSICAVYAENSSVFPFWNAECTPGQFSCGMGKCIPESWKCDGFVDCLEDGSDEPNTCIHQCFNGQVQCALSKKCIPHNWLCDEEMDCSTDDIVDNTDEDWDKFHQCFNGQVQCALSKKCIPHNWLCDEEMDCSTDDIVDNTDEDWDKCHNAVLCHPNELRCGSSNQCVALSKFCDGKPDCSNGEDEGPFCNNKADCENLKCSHKCSPTPRGAMCFCPAGQNPNKTQCVDADECLIDGSCDQTCTNTHLSYVCSCTEGYTLRPDGKSCTAVNVPQDEPASIIFSSTVDIRRIHLNDQFQCESGKVECIDKFLMCNGEKDCTDGSDEEQGPGKVQNLYDITVFENNLFVTSWRNQSIIRVNKYNSDDYETIANFSRPFAIHIYHRQKQPDVPNVGPLCPQMIVSILTIMAPQMCQMYSYVIERRKMFGRGKEVVIDTGIYNVEGMAVDWMANNLYWTDAGIGTINVAKISDFSIRKVLYKVPKYLPRSLVLHPKTGLNADECLIDGSCDQTCTNTHLSYVCSCTEGYTLRPDGKSCTAVNGMYVPEWFRALALDLETYTDEGFSFQGVKTHLYETIEAFWEECFGPMDIEEWDEGLSFLTFAQEAIYFCTHYMEHCMIAIDLNLSKPRGIALDPTSGYMFFTKWGATRPMLERSLLDGTERFPMVTHKIVYPYGVTVDFPTKHVYWVDTYLDFIDRINYDGTDRKTIRKGFPVQNLYDITVFENNLFVTSWRNQSIIRVNKFNSDDYETIANFSRPFAIHIYHRQKQPDVSHPCSKGNGGCRHFCIPKYINGTGVARCVCEAGYSLTPTNKCVSLKPSTFLLYAKGKPAIIKGLTFKRDGTTEQAIMPITDLKRPSVIDYHEKEEYIYYAELTSYVIERRKMFGRGKEVVIDTGIYNVEGMAVDWMANNLYWTDAGIGTINVAKISDFSIRKVLYKVPKYLPRSLVLHPKTGLNNLFSCDNNMTCIIAYWKCDGDEDCKDGSDELAEHCQDRKCDESHFTCNETLRCIPLAWACDGQPDCGLNDTSDEDHCERSCLPTEFTCANKQCLSWTFYCDGFPDCRDGSDETECLPTCGDSTHIMCRIDNKCIPAAKKCDGVNDCTDWSDETNCTHSGNRTISAPACEPHEFDCQDVLRTCIPKALVCDGEPACFNGEDEMFCDTIPVLSTSTTPRPDPEHCEYPNRLCDNTTCIPPSYLCNSKQDCLDGSDEGPICDEKQCLRSDCHHDCYNTPEGFMCVCPRDMYLQPDLITCSYLHPCEAWGTCSQDCEPSVSNNSYKCTCHAGYELEPDMFTCKSKSKNDSSPFVIFSNRHELRGVDLRTFNVIALISSLKNTIALDFYYTPTANMVFWTDVIDDKIYNATLIGNSLSNIDVVVQTGLSTAEGLAVDWIGKNLYWVESNLDQIEVAKLSGQFRRTLIAGDMESPRAIALDPRFGLLFWTDWDSKAPRIERCSMSGEHRSVIVRVDLLTSRGAWPNGLTLDYQLTRIYWIDAKSDSIHTVTYDGKDHHVVLSNHDSLTHPFAIALFENHVYWTDWRTNSVIRANKWNGSDVTLIQRTLTQPFIYVNGVVKKSPCEMNNGNCSHLCLIGMNGTYKCQCPHIMCRIDNKCIPAAKKCDGVNDCTDWSDETNCTHSGNRTISAPACEPHEFDCQDVLRTL
ncbi:low-density lipoprotein receptor-related protein 1B-like [Diaphorina citri]|uniref:Low-density lipoprotein receptor-related protein 1B-like n=1 Tax=Diaphorina citri TaxID=121845 RepID=A0A3Q0IXM5_DIACI|nr:low-density lipoprotein receptor-related protein 1B-like [Diaphorina citri]